MKSEMLMSKHTMLKYNTIFFIKKTHSEVFKYLFKILKFIFRGKNTWNKICGKNKYYEKFCRNNFFRFVIRIKQKKFSLTFFSLLDNGSRITVFTQSQRTNSILHDAFVRVTSNIKEENISTVVNDTLVMYQNLMSRSFSFTIYCYWIFINKAYSKIFGSSNKIFTLFFFN